MIETVGIITEKIMTIMLIIANRGVALNNYLYEVKKETGYGWMAVSATPRRPMMSSWDRSSCR